MNGLRVKLTFTFTAMGNCSSLVVTVVGLTEKEMTVKDFVHVEIPELCIGEGGVSVDSNQQFGHLFLMQNTEGAEKARFRYYQEHELIPGINLQRKNYCNFDITTGTTIPDTATAVAWCGDMSQIDAIKRSVDLYVENKIIANKQNAAWSGVEQPADLARVFKSVKRIQSKHTVRDVPVDRCPMKRLIVGTLKDGYIRKVPLPRVPRIQSASHIQHMHDTCYSAQVPHIPTWSDLTRSLAGLGQNVLQPFSLSLV